MNLINTLSDVFLGLGTFFCMVSVIGILRLPDVFLRLHAASKASTLGLIFLCLATALNFQEPHAIAKSLIVVAFVFLTAPVSGHLIARAAKRRKNPLTKATVTDEYDL